MVCNWLLRRCSRENEPPEETARKRVVLPAAVIIGIPVVLWLMQAVVTALSGTDPYWPLYGTAQVLLLISCGMLLWIPWRSRRLPIWACEVAVANGAVAICVLEVWTLLIFGSSLWFLMIVALDVALLVGARQSIVSALVAGALLMVANVHALRVAGVTRELHFDRDPIQNVSSWIVVSLVFVVDYFCTKTFALSMRQQKAIVEAAVKVSELTAISLSKYEVSDARSIVEGTEGQKLPADLRNAYVLLCRNLTTYKAYLPQSCFHQDAEHASSEDSASRHSDDSSASHAITILRGHRQRDSQSFKEPRCTTDGGARRCSAASGDSSRSGRTSVKSSARQLSEVRVGSLAHAHLMEQLRRELSGAQTAQPRSKVVTVLAANRHGTLQAAESGALRTAGELAAALAADVETFAVQVKQGKGNVDLISGDHRFASFDAVHRCPSHRIAGVRCAWNLRETGGAAQHSAAVCCGATCCGDFGSSEMKRFMIVGGLHCALLSLERIATRRNIQVLIDNKVYQDASVTWACKQIDRVYHHKHLKKAFTIWSVIASPPENRRADEWMYELQDLDPNPYEQYNKIMDKVLKGEFGDADALLLSQLATVDGSEQLAAAYQELQAFLAERRSRGHPTHMLIHDVKLELVSGLAT